MQALIHGIILSFGLILPLGVQNVFIFNQGATHKKFIYACPAIITAGICDTILIFMAVTGVSVVVLNFEWLTILLFIFGFIFLIYMGVVMWRSNPVTNDNIENQNRFSARRQITFAASVSLLNPHAIIDTIGVIGTSSLTYTGHDKLIFAIACIVVSWIWFFFLAMLGRKIGQLGNSRMLLKRMNQISAIIILGMALYLGFNLYAYL
ncbi:LysE/ArgO family amino acid transporter [Alkalihalobacillus hemicellulosilyticus]|uniref:Transporter n=1 Tax=Halalkalibacter hemicellulosilyticusJCM 9152 TaxID=1236971 RepID=W4QM36_9BACI|nr:LysE/ArgO family amino acid transporter [Halalkalibacter hemicellulosilyticus]GAE32942.1 transporter [Halalkalibacter hemicellulosilyticusJCM 9152]